MATKNVFSEMSATKDQNGGGASVDDLGGSAASTKKASLLNANLADSLSKSLESISSAMSGKLKGILGSDLLKNLKLDNLMDMIKNSMKNGLPILGSLESSLNSLISSQLSTLMNDASDSFGFLQKMGYGFAGNLLDSLTGLIVSKLVLPEDVYLAGLKVIKPTKSNIKYNNSYIRNMALRKDLAKVLSFVDFEMNIHYSNENDKGLNDALYAANNGAFHAAKYIMNQLYAELKELEMVFPKVKGALLTKQQDQKKSIEDEILIKENLLNVETNPEVITQLTESIANLKKDISNLDIVKELEYEKDPNYDTVTNMIDKAKRSLHSICRAIIINSYSRLTVSELNSIIKTFDIHPSAFGTNDKEYGRSFFISDSDINIIAPFASPKKSFMEEMKAIESTELVKNDFDQKFISPRNNNAKKIYVYLQSKEIHGDYPLESEKYYDRMTFPIYSTLLSSLDSAASGFFNIGLGKFYVDAINSLDTAYYDYTKSVEDLLFDPAKEKFISFNDLTPIPAPNESESVVKTRSPDQEESMELTSASGPTLVSTLSSLDVAKLITSGATNEFGLTINILPGMNPVGKDPNGNLIYGYPSEATIKEALINGNIGYATAENPNGFPIGPGGIPNPIIGYDEYGNAIYGEPIFYPNTAPVGLDAEGCIVFGYEIIDNVLTPIVGYDKNGNPIYGTPKPEDNVLGPDGKTILGYTVDGKVILGYSRDGRNIIGYNSDGTPIFGGSKLEIIGYDSDNRPIFGYDIYGNPIYGFDTNGDIIIKIKQDGSFEISSSSIAKIIGRTPEGYYIYGYTEKGIPIIGFDKNGKPILGVTDEGYPIIDYDENGDPILGTQIVMNIKKKEIIKVEYRRKDLSNDILNLIKKILKIDSVENRIVGQDGGDIDIKKDMPAIVKELKKTLLPNYSEDYIIGFYSENFFK